MGPLDRGEGGQDDEHDQHWRAADRDAALRSWGVNQMVFPVPQLLIVAVLAALDGLLAAIAPSRRAAKRIAA